MDSCHIGGFGGTYGGNALAAAAGVATINGLRDEDLPGNAAHEGAKLIDKRKELQAEYPMIGDVRGRGLMMGVGVGGAGPEAGGWAEPLATLRGAG